MHVTSEWLNGKVLNHHVLKAYPKVKENFNLENWQNMVREGATCNRDTSMGFNPLHPSDYLTYQQPEQSRIPTPSPQCAFVSCTVLRTRNDCIKQTAWTYCALHSCQQKSIGLKFSKSQTGNDVQYSCHHNSSRFTFPIFAHSCRFSALHSLQSITPRIY